MRESLKEFLEIIESCNSREQMNWTGVQLEKGRVSRLFSSQATNP